MPICKPLWRCRGKASFVGLKGVQQLSGGLPQATGSKKRQGGQPANLQRTELGLAQRCQECG